MQTHKLLQAVVTHLLYSPPDQHPGAPGCFALDEEMVLWKQDVNDLVKLAKQSSR